MGLIDKAGKKILLRLPDLKLVSLAREVMPYVSAEADGLSFIFKNTDHSILDGMVSTGNIWAKEEMDFVLGYYESISGRPGNIIDIGANVGTSIIYFRNHFGEDAFYYAVEPVKDNFDLLKANCALNGYGDINTYKFGISETAHEARMEIDPVNMTTCRIEGSDEKKIVFENDAAMYVGEPVSFITLDMFVGENNVALDRPTLFWIDVEGHEPEAFRSGMDTFKKCDCALFCEFNPKLYQYNGRYDSFIADIKECFGRFICYEQSEPGKYQFRDIGELDKVAEENNMNQCNILLVK